MDSRIRRRQAAQAAPELTSGKVTAVEALADRPTARDAAANGTEAARRRASELVQRARCEGQQPVQQPHAALAATDDSYATGYRAAPDAGWTHTELQQMGYSVPARRRHRQPVDGQDITPPPADTAAVTANATNHVSHPAADSAIHPTASLVDASG
jgi:hypothetical protein